MNANRVSTRQEFNSVSIWWGYSTPSDPLIFPDFPGSSRILPGSGGLIFSLPPVFLRLVCICFSDNADSVLLRFSPGFLLGAYVNFFPDAP